ncbi:hypothetical protein ACWDWO_21605 [Actinopolymorpha singaporensis]
MNFDLNSLISAVVVLAGVPLGSWLTTRGTARAEARAERGALEAQFNAMVVAAAAVRAAVDADRALWNSRWERVRAGTLAAVIGLGPAAFTRGSDRRQIAAFLGGAGWFLAQERTRMQTATASLIPKLAAVGASGAPLLRHSDARVRESTERFIAAIFSYHEARDASDLEAATAAFSSAVRAVLYSTPHRRRPGRRRPVAR